MKKRNLKKVLSLLLVAAMTLAMVPALGLQAQAAEKVPVITLRADTAINPIVDFHATKERGFTEGGPYTLTMEWRAEIEPLSATQTANVFMVPIGYDINNVDQYKAGLGISLRESCDWTQVSWTFETFRYYEALAGVMVAGGLVRLGMWYAYGEVQIRNLVIRNAEGKVLYDMNKDADIAALLQQMDKDGLEETELDNLQAINKTCAWVHAKFGTGNYQAMIGRSGSGTEPEPTEPQGPVFEDPTEPNPTEPKPTEPKPTEPKPTEPKPTEPQPTEPKPTEPKPTEPKPTEPQPTEPKPTEPQPTEPEPTEPQPTEPQPTEPKPTEPKPTEPQPTRQNGGNVLKTVAIIAVAIGVLAAAAIGYLLITGKVGKKPEED